MRRFQILIGFFLTIATLATSAVAGGGSWMEPYRSSYQPGDTVIMRGDVSPGSFGTTQEGPFFAYLRVDPKAASAANPHTYPNIHESDIYLGELQLRGREESLIEVSITFALPADLSDGNFEIVYCNDPCTSGFGDFIGGWVAVRTPRPAPLPGMAPIPVGVYLV